MSEIGVRIVAAPLRDVSRQLREIRQFRHRIFAAVLLRKISVRAVVEVENSRRLSISFVCGFAALTRAKLLFASQKSATSDDGVQPEPLVIDSDHCFVDYDLIRSFATHRL